VTSAITADRLLELTGKELDALFACSPAGAIPRGDTLGLAILAVRGRAPSRAAVWVVRRLAWQGKVFDPETGTLLNKVTPFGTRGVRARVYTAASRLDGREAIVLDYSTTSLLARSVRDEIREVAPGLYLGLVWWRGRRVLRFSLTLADGSRSTSESRATRAPSRAR
jgi:hypothetical protein